MLLAEQGDVPRARAAYQRAIDSGHAEWVPTANTASIAAPEIDGPDRGRSELPTIDNRKGLGR